MNRLGEMLTARNLRGRVVFTGMFNRLTAVDVRARQIAEPLGATYIRGRYLEPAKARDARCLIWVMTADPRVVKEIGDSTRQIFDVINPAIDKGDAYIEMVNEFDALIVNTASTLNYLPRRKPGQWRGYVIPHHHCNTWGTTLPEERLERPKVVGYVGQPEHLHDTEAIRTTVESLGLQFLNADTRDLAAYKRIDIGVAWTKPTPLRDDTRSNIKLTNFCAFGIPSVVCNYESYRDVDRALGGGACLRAESLTDFLEALRTMIRDEELRRSIHAKAIPAQQAYSVEAIAATYRQMLDEVAPA